MGRFAIQCPKCETVNTKGFFASNITCNSCGETFSFRDNRKITVNCDNCHENVIIDQKQKNPKCPLCGNNISQVEAIGGKTVMVTCPECNCGILMPKSEVERSGIDHVCPICDSRFNLAQAYAKSRLVSDTGVSVIKYEGDNSTFVWKHPIEDFNSGSQLIVHESQEAIFFLNGQMLDSFPAGQYTLETQNLPVLRSINKYPIDNGRTPFHAEVYFVNLTVQMGMKWGTDTRVRFIDPGTGLPLEIGASGQLSLQVSDPRKLLVKLVGTEPGALKNKDILSAESDRSEQVHTTLKGFFKAPLMNEVKSHLGAAIKERNIDILEIDAHMSELSYTLHDRVQPHFEKYGLTIPEFFITTIQLPEDDPNFQKMKSLRSSYIGVRQKEIEAEIITAEVGVVSAQTTVASVQRELEITKAQTAAQLKTIAAQGEAERLKTEGFAEAEVMAAKGYNQKDVMQAEVQKAYAE